MTWASATIGELCEKTSQRDPSLQPEDGFLYVDISKVDRNSKTIVGSIQLLGREAPSRARKEIQAGDVLVSTVRPNLNAVAIVPEELSGQIASTGFCVLRPKPGLLIPRYCFYWTQNDTFINHLATRARGASYPAVTDGVVFSCSLPLPPPSEQRRIIEILDQADAIRRRRVEADLVSEQILPALFVNLMGDPTTNPRDWPMASLEDMTSLIHRYPTFYGVDYVSSGVPVVRIGDIQPDGWLSRRPEDYVRVPEDFSTRFPLTLLKTDDLVMAVRGDTTGKLGLVPPELEDANISPNLIRIAPRPGKSTSIYLFVCLSLLARSTETLISNTAKKSITAQNIKGMVIPAAGYEIQLQFDRVARNLMEVLAEQRRFRDATEDLFSSLLNRAFDGTLTAKWREANMKALLAEMEHQARILDCSRIRPA